MFGTILLAVDSSEHSKHATALTAKLASATGDRVVVVHFIERVVTRGGRFFDLETREEADAVVEDHLDTLRGVGVPCEPLVDIAVTGLLPKVLAQVARSLDAGVIVVGSRGLDDLASMVAGAVTHELLHLADRPVLVTRAGDAMTTGARDGDEGTGSRLPRW